MELFTTILLFFIGFFILVRGAQILIKGAISVASFFDVSKWFIGLVIVGIGTSIPEFSINIASVFNGNIIGIETVIGGSTFTILFILGLSALFYPLTFKKVWVYRDIVIDLAAVILVALIITLPILGSSFFLGISQSEGLLLTGLLIFWLIFMFMQRTTPDGGVDVKVLTLFTSVVMILAGVLGVFLGGLWVVGGAEVIAEVVGISPALIALTVVAVGASLPELVVSLVALFKKQTGIAIGNIIGSNIFNFLGIFGITALIRPIAVPEMFRFDILASLGAVFVLFALMFVGKRYTLSRPEGVFLIALYIAYLTFIIIRG